MIRCRVLWLRRLRPFLPWLSLVTGLLGAWFMNRAPGRAFVVIVAAVLGWVMLVVFNLVERNGALKGDGVRQWGARYAIVASNQMAIQQALLFPLPFYLRAAVATTPTVSIHPVHLAFLALYAAALVIALWDPLFTRAMSSTTSALGMQSFAAFVGLNMVLPVLGASNEVSLLVAGAATGLSVPLAMLMSRPVTTWRTRVGAVVGAVLVVVLARLAAPLIPPAPLELVSVAIGTRVEDHELVDPSEQLDKPDGLVCHSAIKAPLGLKDALVHVWQKDGARFDEVHLDMRGGRDAGFRTWSRESPVSRGRFRCTVQTASGQILGAADVDVR